MAVIEESGSFAWLSINLSNSSLMLNEGGHSRKIRGYEGQLVGVDYKHKPANVQYNIPAHYVFRFIFQDEPAIGQSPEELTKYALEIREGNSVANNFINSLLSVPMLASGQPIYFRVYDSNGNTNLFLAESNSDDPKRFDWAFPWNKDIGWFDGGVPKPTDTGELNDNGMPKKDYTAVTAFWRDQFLQRIYPAINGKPYSQPRDEAKANDFIKLFTGNYQGSKADEIKTKWPATAKYINAKFPNQEDKQMILDACQTLFSSKGGKGTLQLDGNIATSTTPKAQEETQPPVEGLDDLPF